MPDEKSIYPKIETGYAFTPYMNDEIVEKFNTQTFTKGRAILKVYYYNPSDLILQHSPVREKVNKQSYIIDTLTSVDNQEIIKAGGKVIEIYEVVIFKKISKRHQLEKLLKYYSI